MLGQSLFSTFEPIGTAKSSRRIHAVDGMRGWASLSVVSFHFTSELFGNIFPIYRNQLTSSFIDGQLAVAIFFTLSGEALSAPYFSGGGRRAVIAIASRRYTRLTIPVLATALLTYGLIRCGLVYNQAAGLIVQQPDWLASWLRWDVSLLGTINFALLKIYTQSRSLMIPFLWTMRIELLGSLLTFSVLILCHRTKIGWQICLGIMFIIAAEAAFGRRPFVMFLACFMAGIFFAKCRYIGAFEQAQASGWAQVVTSIGLITIFAANSIVGDRPGDLIYHEVKPCLLAILLCGFAYSNAIVSKFLCTSISQYLGRVSFPLFLIQFSVIISFSSLVIVRANEHNSLYASSPWIVVASIAICLAAAEVYRPIEWITHAVGKSISRTAIMLLERYALSSPGTWKSSHAR